MPHDRSELSVGGPAGIRLRSESPGSLGRADAWPPVSPRQLASLGLASRRSRRVAAGLLVFLGALLGCTGWVLTATLGLPSALLLPAVIVVLGLWLGAAALWRPGGRGRIDPAIEARILDLAARDRGRLTVARTAHQLGLSLAEADHTLSTLARAGHLDVDLDGSTGAVLYVLRDFTQALPPRP